jgi:hypothetical protein
MGTKDLVEKNNGRRRGTRRGAFREPGADSALCVAGTQPAFALSLEGRCRASCETSVAAPALESLLVRDPGRFQRGPES